VKICRSPLGVEALRMFVAVFEATVPVLTACFWFAMNWTLRAFSFKFRISFRRRVQEVAGPECGVEEGNIEQDRIDSLLQKEFGDLRKKNRRNRKLSLWRKCGRCRRTPRGPAKLERSEETAELQAQQERAAHEPAKVDEEHGHSDKARAGTIGALRKDRERSIAPAGSDQPNKFCSPALVGL
jgi:hypothetical protein